MDRTGEQWPGPAEPSGPPPTPMPWPGYNAPPPPAPPPVKSPNRLIAIIATVGLLLVACAGATAYGVVKALRDTEPAAERSLSGAAAAPSGAPSQAPASKTPGRPAGVTGKVPAGSKASSYRVRKPEDLERLCDRWYYPKAPKYTSTVAPHPISISVRDRKDLDIRTPESYLDLPTEAGPAVQAAWRPEDPAKVQLVACVDLVTIGAKVKSCRIDKPEPSSIAMKEGTYRLALYEVATRRKLLETKLTGEDETCPFFIVIGNDRAVYSGLEDSQLVEALRRYVEE